MKKKGTPQPDKINGKTFKEFLEERGESLDWFKDGAGAMKLGARIAQWILSGNKK